MRCNVCNNEISNEAKFCPICGSMVQVNTVNNNFVSSAPIVEEKANVGLAVLSFFIPLAGLILFLVKRKEEPKTAKACGISALVSWLIGILLVVLIFVLSYMAVDKAIDTAKDNVNDYYEKYKDEYDYDYDDDYSNSYEDEDNYYSDYDEEDIYDGEEGFKKLGFYEAVNIITSNEKQIILLTSSNCSHCTSFATVLKQVRKDLDLTINYFDIMKLSTVQKDIIESSLSGSDYSGGTVIPTVLIVQNGNVIAYKTGNVELEVIKKFFLDNGYGK